MKYRTLLAAAFLFAWCVPGCGDDDEPAPQGSAQCDELGELCHEAGEIDADAEECHEIGHTGVASECAARYDECKTLCEMILANAGGAGGGAGAPSSGGTGGS